MLRLLFASLIILHCVVLLPYPLFLFLSPMLFDSPGSASNPLTKAIFFSFVAYPIPVVTAAVLSRKNIKTQDTMMIFKYFLLSVSSPAILGFFILLLGVFCGGKFSC